MKKINNYIFALLMIFLSIIYFLIMCYGRYKISYIDFSLFFGLASLFVYFYGVCVNNKKTFSRNIYIYIFIYIVVLISLTFFIGRTNIRFYDRWWYSFQTKPFYTISSQLRRGTSKSIFKNVICNFFVITPLSLLLMIRDKKYENILRQAFFALPLILFIELFQSYTHTGVFDIDDIILNYFGTVFFTLLIVKTKIINIIRHLFNTDFNLSVGTKYIFLCFSITLLIIYSIKIILIIF